MTKSALQKQGVVLFVLGVAFLLIYRPVWHGQFLYDDFWYIVRNPFMHRPLAFLSLFNDARTAADPSSGLTTDIYRPLSTGWFWIDAHFWGPHPFPYHMENLLLHLANTFLVFMLLRKWMGNSAAALAGCAVFLLHPIQVESVAWITQRSTLASTACLLLALGFLTAAPHSVRRPAWLLGILFASAALLFREIPIVLPLLFGIIISTLIKTPLRQTWKNKYVVTTFLALLVLCFLYLGIRQAVLGQLSQRLERPGYGMENSWYGLCALPVYLGKLLLPLKLRVTYSYPSFSPAQMVLSLLTWIIFAGVIFYFGRRDRWTAAGLLWAGISLLPVMHIVPIRAFVAERFLYLSMIGVAMVVCRLMRRSSYVWFFLPWLLFLTAMTWRTVPAWKNEESLWARAVQQDPDNAFAHLCYGSAMSDPVAASEQYRQALLHHPNRDEQFVAFNNLADLLLNQGHLEEALPWAKKAVYLKPDNAAAQYNLARAIGTKKR